MTKTIESAATEASIAGNPGPSPSDPAYAGQARYTPWFLAHVYDRLVLNVVNPLVWRCPSRHIEALYAEHLGDHHLDVGPGTGYFLDRSGLTSPSPSITLLDINADALASAASRIKRFRPRTIQASVLEPLELENAGFGSLALTHVLHCLPGRLTEKARVIDHLSPLLRPGGWLFGSTVLHGGVRHTLVSRKLLRFLNRKGVFCNLDDDAATLEDILAARFTEYELRIQGSVALFAARV
jgi:SAM-dependent methyltransferase